MELKCSSPRILWLAIEMDQLHDAHIHTHDNNPSNGLAVDVFIYKLAMKIDDVTTSPTISRNNEKITFTLSRDVVHFSQYFEKFLHIEKQST
jgi:hypothetical protein